eukprot:TRINITY_DN596_c0_g1_i1.p1 TRINITY_DN596_c0_g1~~TRINITY_DN596_c0_g1_i1.p1  ORF type:complete len:196 (+),score=16.22 TRINITY_DN596_c0_g1_i1:147-734(+)
MARTAMARALAGACHQCSLASFARQFSSGPEQINLSAPISLAEARTWDEGIASKFATTPLSKIFKDRRVVIFGLPGAYTGVCSQQHVPSYLRAADKIILRNVDEIICVSVNDPYALNAWAEKLGAKHKISFYGDYLGEFHKHLGLDYDLSEALLGGRSNRWSAFVEDGKIKVLNVEANPGEFKVSDADTILKSLY